MIYNFICVEITSAIVALRNEFISLKSEHNILNYDIWTESGRSRIEQQNFKKRLISYYRRKSALYVFNNKIGCMVTNQYHNKNKIIASHLWKNSLHGRGLHKFGLTLNDATSYRNGILMLKHIEEQFDVKYLCFICNPFEAERKITIKILNPVLLDVTINESDPPLTFRDINGFVLQHPAEVFPFRRILSFHALCSHKFASSKGWITENEANVFENYHALSETASIPDISTINVEIED